MVRQAAELRSAARSARAGNGPGVAVGAGVGGAGAGVDADSPWADLAGHLDAAIAGLRPRDRDAVVMRFLEKRSLAEVGAALGLSEHAAQMRVSRAVEKLRAFFGRRGAAVSAVGLLVLLDAHAAPAAPPALAAKLTPSALRAVRPDVADLARRTAWSVAREKAALAVPVLVALAIWGVGGLCLTKALADQWATPRPAVAADAGRAGGTPGKAMANAPAGVAGRP